MRLTTKVIIATFVGSMAMAATLPAAGRSYVPTDEAKVRSMVNKTRAEKGLPPLKSHDQLIAMARGQSDRMEDRGGIYHNPQLGAEATRRGLNWERIGENVGMGPNVELIQQAFLDSPHHYENIVHPAYNHVGIGVVKGDDGKMYVTQVFADLKSAPAPKPAAAPKPAPVVAKPAPAPAAPAPAAPTVAGATAPRPATAPQAAAPTPAAATAPKPSVDPNAVIGGYVEDGQLPEGNILAASDGTFERVIDAIVFWA
jgi:hypothetical protein